MTETKGYCFVWQLGNIITSEAQIVILYSESSKTEPENVTSLLNSHLIQEKILLT